MLVSCKLIMESFSCDLCGCNYKSKTKLRKHQERIHDVRSYTCEHCNKVLVGKHTLRNHIATHKETICKKCGLSIPKNSRSSHKMKCSFSEDINKHELSVLLPQNFFSHNVFKWVMVLVQIITDQTNSKLAPPSAHK